MEELELAAAALQSTMVVVDLVMEEGAMTRRCR
jgi:hypothetical protein